MGGWIIFQPYRKEVDPVLCVGRCLDEVTETTIDLMRNDDDRIISWNLWKRPLSAEQLTCFILKMSKTGAAASTFSRSSGGSLSMGGEVPAGAIILRVAVKSLGAQRAPLFAFRETVFRKVALGVNCLFVSDGIAARHIGIAGYADVRSPGCPRLLLSQRNCTYCVIANRYISDLTDRD